MKSFKITSHNVLQLMFVSILMLFGSVHLLAATITSTGSGGSWSATSTWVGGTVPGVNDDVIIAGTVYVDGAYTCNSVTINSGATFLNAAYHYTLTVNNGFTNNGTLSNNINGWNLTVNIKGNVVNNGIWKPYATALIGNSNQYLTCGSNKKFEGVFNISDTLGDIYLNSNVWFDNNALNMNQVKFYTNGYVLKGTAQNITYGRIFTNDTMDLNQCNFIGITVTGSFAIKGKLWLQSGNTFNGTVTIMDTLLDNYYHYSLNVNGNFINRGVIMRDPNFWNLSLYISGNIENYGIWRPYETILNGTSNQTIKEIPSKTFEGWFTSSDTLGNIILISDVQFTGSTFYTNNTKIVTNGFKLYSNNYIFNAARIISNDTLLLYETRIVNTSINGTFMIKGKLWIQSGNTFIGTATLIDTMLDDYYHYDLTVNGNLINKGAIIRDPNYWNLSLYINGNIENYGVWRPYQTVLNGTANQTIKESAGKIFENMFSSSDTLGNIILSSDVQFDGNIFYFNNARLVTNGFKLYCKNYTIHTARITSNDTLLLYQTYFYNTSVTGTFMVKGRLFLQAGNSFIGTATLIDTLQNDGYHYDFTINGNFINKGIVMNYPGWNLSLYVNGDIDNQGIWQPYQTILNGSGNQNIKETTGKKYEGWFTTNDTLGDMILMSPVAMNASTWFLNKARLRTNGYKLTTTGYTLNNGRIISNDTMMLNESRLINTNITGNFKLDGNIWIQVGNTFNGTATILDTIRNDYFHYDLYVTGDVINKGAIIRDPNSWNFVWYITGNIMNQGIWRPYQTFLNGTGVQTIGQSTGKKFECQYYISDTVGSVNLSSNIYFEGYNFDLGGETVNTNGFIWSSLNHRVSNGALMSNDTINWYNSSIVNLTFNGNYKLKGKIWFEGGITFNGVATVLDTLINNYYHYTLTVNGDLNVTGVLKRDPSNWNFFVTSKGNIIIDGTYNVNGTTLVGTGPRNISGKSVLGIPGGFTVDDSIQLTGDNILSSITFTGNSKAWCRVLPNASVTTTTINNYAKLLNYGRVTMVQDIDSTNANTYNYYYASLNTKKSTRVNKLTLDHYGYQSHPNVSGAVFCWWRLKNYPLLFNDTLNWLKLSYNDDALNGNLEDSLRVYFTPNAGVTWVRIKTGVTIDKVNNQITILKAPSYGHYILSTTALGITTFRAYVERAEPRNGGNSGKVTMYVFGAGLKKTTTARLKMTGQADIVADTTMITDFVGESMMAIFNLKGKALGAWNLVVETPGDTTITLPNYFTIKTGDRSRPWSTLSGRDRFLINRYQNFYINYGNSANTDAYGTMMVYVVNDITGLDVTFPDIKVVLPKPIIDMGSNYTRIADSVKTYYLTDTLTGYKGTRMRVYPFYIPTIPAQSSKSIRVRLKLTGAGALDMAVWTMDPMFESIDLTGLTSDPMPAEVRACITAAAMKYTWTGAIGLIPGMGCYNLVDKIVDPIGYITPESMKPEDVPTDTWGSWIWNKVSWASSITQCATSFVPGLGQATAIGIGLAGMVIDMKDNYDVNEACWRKFKRKSEDKRKSNGVVSMDPNEIVGPQGFATDRYILKKNNVSYRIYFENKATATAPALEVFIKDTLDKSRFDLSTFSFGTVSFGDTTIRIQEYAKEFAVLADMYPLRNVIVRIYGKLDTATGIAQWSFISLDRITGEPTEDVDLGFLPPNVISPQGEGNVSFSCMMKTTVAHNDFVTNRASITFDLNPPILTNTYSNRVDDRVPVSAVTALSSQQADTVFTVSWTGSDQGCGIKYYNVFVSVNDSPYVGWKLNTNLTSASYKGKNNYKYKFYSIASDSLDLVEADKTAAEATTTIKLTGIDDPKREGLFVLYPNPSRGVVHAEITIPTEDVADWYVVDITGKTVARETGIHLHEGPQTISINLNGLPAGVYFIEWHGQKYSTIQKMMLIR